MISVIIPVYNVVDVMHHSIQSILIENCDNVQIIIVDDGSTDGSARICDEYASEPNVIVIHKVNGGLSSARNAGMKVATGDYVMFLDSDDYLRPGTLKFLSEYIKKFPQSDFIQYKYKEVSDYTQTMPVELNGEIEIETSRKGMYERMLHLGGIGASACTKLIARRIFDTVQFTEGIIYEDEDFTVRLIEHAKQAIYLNTVLYLYVWRKGSIITQKYSPKRLDIIPVLQRQIRILEKNSYYDLSMKVKRKLFINLLQFYVQARHNEFNNDVKNIKKALVSLAPALGSLQGDIFSKLALALKYKLPILQVYYLFKVMRK